MGWIWRDVCKVNSYELDNFSKRVILIYINVACYLRFNQKKSEKYLMIFKIRTGFLQVFFSDPIQLQRLCIR